MILDKIKRTFLTDVPDFISKWTETWEKQSISRNPNGKATLIDHIKVSILIARDASRVPLQPPEPIVERPNSV